MNQTCSSTSCNFTIHAVHRNIRDSVQGAWHCHAVSTSVCIYRHLCLLRDQLCGVETTDNDAFLMSDAQVPWHRQDLLRYRPRGEQAPVVSASTHTSGETQS